MERRIDPRLFTRIQRESLGMPKKILNKLFRRDIPQVDKELRAEVERIAGHGKTLAEREAAKKTLNEGKFNFEKKDIYDKAGEKEANAYLEAKVKRIIEKK